MTYHLFPEIDGTDAITKEAVQFLKSNLAGKGEIFVAFSGGKDSIATAELMRLSGLSYRLFYSFTGIDPPEVVRFIRRNYPDCVFLKPRRTFWRDLSVNCPPSDKIRWCCTLLKKEPSWRLGHEYRVMGIRAEESFRRSKYGRINHFKNQHTDHMQFYPIYHWNESQLWDFIIENGLKYPSLYNEGFDRVGCVVCPYHSEPTGKIHQMYRDRWPKFFNLFEKEIEKLYAKRKKKNKNNNEMEYETAQRFCNAWYKYKNARWYKED